MRGESSLQINIGQRFCFCLLRVVLWILIRILPKCHFFFLFLSFLFPFFFGTRAKEFLRVSVKYLLHHLWLMNFNMCLLSFFSFLSNSTTKGQAAEAVPTFESGNISGYSTEVLAHNQ